MLNTKIFLRQSDIDTALYAEKLCGYVEDDAHAVTKVADSMKLIYEETSRTVSRQLRSRVPAEYFLSLPDGDAIIVNDKRHMAWFPAYGMTPEQEITWREMRWPDRPRLLHPSEFRQ